MSTDFLVVTTTVADVEQARALGRALVESRLAACAQTMPIESVYRWREAIETASEHMLLCKVRACDLAEIEAAIRAAHPYETPEIVATPIASGSADYLAWLGESTRR